MTGKEYLMSAVEILEKGQRLVESLPEGVKKADFIKKMEDQKATIENMMERVFFKTPKGTNSASIVLESAQKLQSLLEDLCGRPDEERQKRWPEAEDGLHEFVERVEGMVQSAQGKTLAFT